MICIPGKCIKCERTIAAGNMPSHMYCQVELELDDGSILHIGICNDCVLENDELQLAIDAVSKAMNGMLVDRKIKSFLSKKNTKQIAMERQQGMCMACMKPLGENYIMLHGNLLHENCNMEMLYV